MKTSDKFYMHVVIYPKHMPTMNKHLCTIQRQFFYIYYHLVGEEVYSVSDSSIKGFGCI